MLAILGHLVIKCGAGPGGRPEPDRSRRGQPITFRAGLPFPAWQRIDRNHPGNTWPGSGKENEFLPGKRGMSCPAPDRVRATEASDWRPRLTVVAGGDGCRPAVASRQADGGRDRVNLISEEGGSRGRREEQSGDAVESTCAASMHRSALVYGGMKKGLHGSVPRLTRNVSLKKRRLYNDEARRLGGPVRSACQSSYRFFGLAGSSRFYCIIRHFGESVLIRMRKLLGNGSCRRLRAGSTMMLRFGVTAYR
jgi:hypothetical protein